MQTHYFIGQLICSYIQKLDVFENVENWNAHKKLLLDFQFQSFHFLGKLCIKSSLEVDSNTPSMLCDNVKEKKRFFLTFINHKDYNHIGVNVEENCGAYHTELALGDVTMLHV